MCSKLSHASSEMHSSKCTLLPLRSHIVVHKREVLSGEHRNKGPWGWMSEEEKGGGQNRQGLPRERWCGDKRLIERRETLTGESPGAIAMERGGRRGKLLVTRLREEEEEEEEGEEWMGTQSAVVKKGLPRLSEAELLMSPVMKEDSDCFLTVSFHMRRIRLCRGENRTVQSVKIRIGGINWNRRRSKEMRGREHGIQRESERVRERERPLLKPHLLRQS